MKEKGLKFFMDEARGRHLLTRYSVRVENRPYIQHLFAFASTDAMIKFFKADDDTLVWDEHGVPWTVGSLRYEIIRSGAVVIGR